MWVYVCVSCRRRRLVKVGLGRPKPRKDLVDFGNAPCYYICRVYQDLPHRVTKPKAPSVFAGRAKDLVRIGNSERWADLLLPCTFTKCYHLTINRVICYYHSPSTVSYYASWATPNGSATGTCHETHHILADRCVPGGLAWPVHLRHSPHNVADRPCS